MSLASSSTDRDALIMSTWQVYVVDVDTGARRYAGRGDDPAWSPDNRLSRAYPDPSDQGPIVIIETAPYPDGTNWEELRVIRIPRPGDGGGWPGVGGAGDGGGRVRCCDTTTARSAAGTGISIDSCSFRSSFRSTATAAVTGVERRCGCLDRAIWESSSLNRDRRIGRSKSVM